MTTWYLEVPESERIVVDVDRWRPLVRFFTVGSALGEREIESAILDTGCALPILAPLGEVEALFDPDDCAEGVVNTDGGRVKALAFQGSLMLGHWRFPSVEIRAAEEFRSWLIGMPILRNFNLLFREPLGQSAALWGPDPKLAGVLSL